MERAAALNPLQPEYRHDLAMAIVNSGPIAADGFAGAGDDLREARRHGQQASALGPQQLLGPVLVGQLHEAAPVPVCDEEYALAVICQSVGQGKFTGLSTRASPLLDSAIAGRGIFQDSLFVSKNYLVIQFKGIV